MKSLIIMLVGICITLMQAKPGEQRGFLSGSVQDSATGQPLPFAHLELLKGNISIKGHADEEGKFRLGPVSPGMYSLCASYLGYPNDTIRKIVIKPDKTVFLTVRMEKDSESIHFQQVTIVRNRKPVLDRSACSGGETYTREEIKKIPTRSVNGVIGSSVGVYSGSGNLHGNGGRNTGNVYIVDGIKLRSAPNMNGTIYPPVQTQQGAPAPEKEFNTEEYSAIEENIWQSPKNEPLSTFSIDVDKASYANVRRYIDAGQLPPAGSVRTEEMINYFNYQYPQPADDKPFTMYTEQGACPWNKAHQLVMLGLQAKKIDDEQLPSSNLVFLIDVSGSMADFNKLPLVKESLKMLVSKLREQDHVSIVVYAGNAGMVLPSTSGGSKNKINNAIDRLEAGGSTAGGAGILLAYHIARKNFVKGGNNRVILATDGDFNVGVSSNGDLEKLIEEKRKNGIYLTVLGYGMGNYKDSKMEVLADKGNGNYAYVDNIEEARKVLVTEFAGTLYTVAKDVKIQIEWNPAIVGAYRLIGYEDRKLNAEDFNNDTKDAGEIGSGHTVTALYEVIPAGLRDTFNSVDSLKYQRMAEVSEQYSKEILTLKVRYKLPEEEKSQLLLQPVNYAENVFDSASENFRWAAAVAGFSLLLTNSPYKGDLTYDNVVAYAKAAQKYDPGDYRGDAIKLMKKAEEIQSKLTRK